MSHHKQPLQVAARVINMLPPVTTLLTVVLLGTAILAAVSAGAQSVPTAPPADANAPATVPAAGQDPPAQNPPQNPPPKKPKRTIYLGPNVGVFLPTSSKTRSQFSGAWWDFGLGLGINTVKLGGSLRPDLHILSQSADNNRLFIGLLGVEYRKPILFRPRRRTETPDQNGGGKPQDDRNGVPGDGSGRPPTQPDPNRLPPARTVPYLLPYFGFSADLGVGDLRDVGEGIHSGVRTGAFGSAFLGVNIGKRFYLETRYREATSFKGFDLSGLNVTAGYRFRL